jgi:hypothetical protein
MTEASSTSKAPATSDTATATAAENAYPAPAEACSPRRSPTPSVSSQRCYQRKLCTHDTLAELFRVSRRTIGDIVREVGPILTQDGFTPTRSRRFANAANLLDSIPAATDTATRPR